MDSSGDSSDEFSGDCSSGFRIRAPSPTPQQRAQPSFRTHRKCASLFLETNALPASESSQSLRRINSTIERSRPWTPVQALVLYEPPPRIPERSSSSRSHRSDASPSPSPSPPPRPSSSPSPPFIETLPDRTDRLSLPPWDRTVDIVYHQDRHGESRYDRTKVFVETLDTFSLDRGRLDGRESTIRLPSHIRFLVYKHLIASLHGGWTKPVMLNLYGFNRECWDLDDFITLGEVMEPLLPYFGVSFGFYADIMVTFLMEHSFHATFSPFVGTRLNPSVTDWLNKYGPYMRSIILEVDLSRLYHGPHPGVVNLNPAFGRLEELLQNFSVSQLKRECSSPLESLVLLCRRFYERRKTIEVHQPVERAKEENLNGRRWRPFKMDYPESSISSDSSNPDHWEEDGISDDVEDLDDADRDHPDEWDTATDMSELSLALNSIDLTEPLDSEIFYRALAALYPISPNHGMGAHDYGLRSSAAPDPSEWSAFKSSEISVFTDSTDSSASSGSLSPSLYYYCVAADFPDNHPIFHNGSIDNGDIEGAATGSDTEIENSEPFTPENTCQGNVDYGATEMDNTRALLLVEEPEPGELHDSEDQDENDIDAMAHSPETDTDEGYDESDAAAEIDCTSYEVVPEEAAEDAGQQISDEAPPERRDADLNPRIDQEGVAPEPSHVEIDDQGPSGLPTLENGNGNQNFQDGQDVVICGRTDPADKKISLISTSSDGSKCGGGQNASIFSMALEDPDGPETPRSSISSEDSLGSHGSAEAEVVGAFGEIFDDLGDSLIHQVWKDLADVEETLEGTLEGNDIEDDLRDDGFFPGDSSSESSCSSAGCSSCCRSDSSLSAGSASPSSSPQPGSSSAPTPEPFPSPLSVTSSESSEPGALVSEPLRDLHLGPPFCDADQSICDHLLRLRGRVASIRMAGFTEAYTHRFIAGLFPSASHVPIAQHAYRVSPSTAWPRISGQQSWVDHRGTRVLDDHDQVGDLPAGEFPEGPVPLPAPIVGEDGTATLPALRRPLLPRRLRVRVAVEPGDWIGDVSRYSWEAYYEDGDSSCASSVRSEPTMQLEREYPEGEGLSRSGYAHKRSFSI